MDNRKLIVFDMDDVLWDLNQKAARIAGVEYEKLDCFILQNNKNITDKERNRVSAAYMSKELYKEIVFYENMIALINRIHREYPQYEVQIVSNCVSEEVKELKSSQLLPLLDIPESQIHMHIIDLEKGSGKKKLPPEMFIFVDDSPHNIVLSDVNHRIMPAKPYNNVLEDGCVGGLPVERSETIDMVVEAVMRIIENDT